MAHEAAAAERAAGKVRGTAAVTPANVPVAAMVGRSSRAVSRRVEAVAQGAEDAVAVGEAGVGAEAEGIPAARSGGGTGGGTGATHLVLMTFREPLATKGG